MKNETDDDQLSLDSDDEFFPVCKLLDYVSPEGVTFEILENSSGKSADKLFSSTGYSYGLRHKTHNGEKRWRCNKRGKIAPCRARIVQKSTSDMKCIGDHVHPPDPNEYMSALLSTAIKRKIASNPESSVAKLVEKIRNKHLPKEFAQVPSLSYQSLLHMAHRHKRLALERRNVLNNGEDSVTIAMAPASERALGNAPKRVKLGGFQKRRLRSETRASPKHASKNGNEFCINPDISDPGRLSSGVNSTVQSESSCRPSLNIPVQLDADDMFFHSISAVVKDLPKVAKSSLKLEILTVVNAAIQNEGNKNKQAISGAEVLDNS